jgi:hypothetical protein
MYRVLRASALLPDREVLIYLRYDARPAGGPMLISTLPPDGSRPVHLDGVDFDVGAAGLWDRYRVTAAENGRALIPVYHFLLTLGEKQFTR